MHVKETIAMYEVKFHNKHVVLPVVFYHVKNYR